MPSRGGVYGNCWITAWTSDWLISRGEYWVTCGNTGEGNSPVWLEGVKPGSTSSRSSLRADCHWGRISFWRWLLLEFSCEPTTQVSTFHLFQIIPFQQDNLSSFTICGYQSDHTILYIYWLYNTILYICWLYSEHMENTYSTLKLFVPQSENLSMVDRGKLYLKEINWKIEWSFQFPTDKSFQLQGPFYVSIIEKSFAVLVSGPMQ